MALAIAYRRKKANLTQVELAAAVGVNQSSVCQWETGSTTPRVEMLPSIAKACKCEIGELFIDGEEAGQSDDPGICGAAGNVGRYEGGI